MEHFKKSVLVLVGTVSIFAGGRRCDARDFLLNNDKMVWVASRAVGDPIPGSEDVIAIAITVEGQGHGNRIKARLFTYSDVDDGHYSEREELTTESSRLEGTVDKPEPGKGRNGRQTVTLTSDDLPNVVVYLTALWRRNPGAEPTERRILCRIRFLPQVAAAAAVPAAANGCDEPPTDDILEEEPIDPDGDGVPEEDPEYYDPTIP